jgi:hypothetical protein
MSIWNLPESVALREEVLEKLSVAPWRLSKNDVATNTIVVKLLRPVIDDLMEEECYIEIRRITNRSCEAVLATQLSPERAALWETNLAIVVASLAHQPIAKVSSGWLLRKHDFPQVIEFTRVKDWAIVGFGSESNSLISDFRGRVESHSTPITPRRSSTATNYWLALDLALGSSAQASAIGWRVPAESDRISLTVSGDGQGVLTRGEVGFSKPFDFDLEAWNIPTNLIRDPLIGFAAGRGLTNWLSPVRQWSEYWGGAPPNQFYVWSQQGIPLQTYFAAPSSEASNQVRLMAGRLLEEGNPWLAAHGMGEFQRRFEGRGVAWTGAPFVAPFLQSIHSSDGDFLLGGLIPEVGAQGQPPAGLFSQLWSPTNLLAYEWELTGPRVESFLFVGQAFRVILARPQLPFDSTSMKWLKAAGAKLGNCGTIVSLAGPTKLAFTRRSSVGFSALELHLLADWIESPQFPIGLHTLLARTEMPVTNPPVLPVRQER